MLQWAPLKLRVFLGVKTCEVFLCFLAIVRVVSIMLTSLFCLFYVTGEYYLKVLTPRMTETKLIYAVAVR